jgi:type II secretory pathway pseudopilin PulG
MQHDRAASPPRPDDAGASLVELLVTMGVMSVVMMIFSGSILQVYRSATRTETQSDTQNELSRAFQRFDRELRYASWIAEPGTVGPASVNSTWYVEFAGADPTQCHQLRLVPGSGSAQGVLQLLSWTKGSPPAPGTPGQTIASQIVTKTAAPDKPVAPYFERQPYGATPYAAASPSPSATPSGETVGAKFKSVFQRLRIRLTTRAGTATAHIDTTFTALNTTKQTPLTHGCSQGRPQS